MLPLSNILLLSLKSEHTFSANGSGTFCDSTNVLTSSNVNDNAGVDDLENPCDIEN